MISLGSAIQMKGLDCALCPLRKRLIEACKSKIERNTLAAIAVR
jgi:hypothetical protein